MDWRMTPSPNCTANCPETDGEPERVISLFNMAFRAAGLPTIEHRITGFDDVEFARKKGRQTRYLTVAKRGRDTHCIVTEQRGEVSLQKTHFCLDDYPFCNLVDAVRWLSFDKNGW